MNDLLRLESNADADLFDALHRLLEEQPRPGAPERRRSERRPYQCVQLLAFYDGRTAPGHADFRPVQFHDLSPGGFSFYAEAPPRHRHLIVALGGVPFTFFAAQVLRMGPVADDNRRGYLLGCRFLKRIVTPADVMFA